MMRTPSLITALIVLLAPAHPSAGQSSQLGPRDGESALRQRLPNVKINARLPRATLPDLAALLARETGLPVIADCYPNDPVVAELNLENMPLHAVVEKAPALYNRTALLISDVIVLRHSQWMTASRVSGSLYTWSTPPEGRGAIERVAADGDRFLIRAAIREVSAGRLAEQVSKLQKGALRIQASLAQRRISMYAQAISPLQIADALTSLWLASASVAIGQTDSQRSREDTATREALDSRPEDKKLSDELFREIASLLSPHALPKNSWPKSAS